MLSRELHTLESNIRIHEQCLLGDEMAAAPLVRAGLVYKATLEQLCRVAYEEYLTKKYAEGDKESKLLAWLLRSDRPRVPITTIHDKRGSNWTPRSPLMQPTDPTTLSYIKPHIQQMTSRSKRSPTTPPPGDTPGRSQSRFNCSGDCRHDQTGDAGQDTRN
ncbi:hypothetical protein NDU88_006851 [Pleurodeles waltl]|uniref:Uncharacterized protein n=1 Tax=Pleurodeles waltl TaxID=8319 RepID=A0AAV7ME15_PLEWA|nr:hypothetical protein NDU88_006851 [Pleurodeles waltl]